MELFSKYGKVVDAQIVRNKRKGLSRGFGFIGYETEDEVNKALQALNGFELDGKVLKLEVSSSDGRFQNLTKDVSNETKESALNIKAENINESPKVTNVASKKSDGRIRPYSAVYHHPNSDINTRNPSQNVKYSMNSQAYHSQFDQSKLQSFELNSNPQGHNFSNSQGNIAPNVQMYQNHQSLNSNPSLVSSRNSNLMYSSSFNHNEENMRLHNMANHAHSNMPSEVYNRNPALLPSHVSTIYQPQHPTQDQRFVANNYCYNYQHHNAGASHAVSNIESFHMPHKSHPIPVCSNVQYSNGHNIHPVIHHNNMAVTNSVYCSNFQPNSNSYYQSQPSVILPNTQFTPQNHVNDNNRASFGQPFYNQDPYNMTRIQNVQPAFIRSQNGVSQPRYSNEFERNYMPSNDGNTANLNPMILPQQVAFRNGVPHHNY